MEKPDLTDPELEAHAQFEPTENLQGKNAPAGDDFVAETKED